MIAKAQKTTTKKKLALKPKTGKKKLSFWRPLVLSRHPSHQVLRAATKNLPLNRFPVCIRFGSTTELEDTIAKGGRRLEINNVQSIKNSANKLLMKRCFLKAGAKTAEMWTEGELKAWAKERYPIVAKAHYGSRGTGNTLIKTEEELNEWAKGKTQANYIFERFMNFGNEFRLHVSGDGCFYTCRKALKENVDEDKKWSRHDDNCVWFLESNPEFNKPNSWNDIVKDCVNSLKEIGADILSFDVKVQSPRGRDGKKRDYQEYILLECNSASSMDNGTGELSHCAKAYIQEIPKIINRKAHGN